MRVISNKQLVVFATRHPNSDASLQAWRRLIETNEIPHFAAMRQIFGSVDIVGDKHVFDIKGNRYRIIAGIGYPVQICYIKHVLTHAEYDKGDWK